MKTIILFVIGLLSWLLITNYQIVHSKVVSFTNPTPIQESVELVVAEADIGESLPPEQITEAEAVKTDITENTSDMDHVTEPDSIDDLAEASDSSSEIINVTATPQTEPEASSEKDSDSVANEAAATTQIPMNHPWMSANSTMPSFNQNMMNSGIMNPAMFMNPMAMMTPMMMSIMGPMMNPNAMINHPINAMTHPQNMNAMMMSMNPNMMFSMFGQPSKEYLEGEVPDQLPVVTIPGMPTQSYQNWPVNKLAPGVSREAKKNAFQTAMAMSPLNMRDMMGIMADKIPVEEGVTWDDAVEAMKLRANEVNFKFVGSSPLWKQIEAETEQPSAKVEMFRFCDATVARKILDVVPEFIVFLPCKIALLEDGEGKLWVMTMDWDISWLDFSQNPNSHFSKEIREDAKRIRDNLTYIMEGAATGDF